MTPKTLFIGAGAMGGAILRGALHGGILQANEVFVLEHSESKCQRLESELAVTASTVLPDLSQVELIVFAVKPQVLPDVLANMSNLQPSTILVSIAAGISLAQLQEAVPSQHWYRAMPNIAVSVGAGLTAITAENEKANVPSIVVQLFENIGETVIVNEMDLERIGAVCGAGIGFAFVMLDAMADAGVRIGMPRALAIKAAAHALEGAGTLALQTGTHPAVLRDQVTSPGGTTIAGIAAMERGGARSALHEAVVASFEKSAELGKKK